MLSATFPYPPTRGGTQVRTFHLLKALQPHHRITLVTQRSADVTDWEVLALGEMVQELQVFPRPPASGGGGLLGKGRRFARFLRRGTPPSVGARFSPEMAAWVETAAATGRFQGLTCEHGVNEAYVTAAVAAAVPRRVVNIHSLVSGTCRQQLATGMAEKPLRDRLTLPLLERYERRYCRKFTDLVVTTPEDAQQLAQLLGDAGPIHVVTNGVDLATFPPRPQDPGGQQLVFIGAMDNLPNIDAATFLCRDILPLVRQDYPGVTVTLVGSHPTPAVQALGEIPGVTVTGRVPAMVPYLHQAAVVVIPMRTGFGIKNKTLEAMAAASPVVGSDRALEGLPLDSTGAPAALRANTAVEFHQAIGQLLADGPRRHALGQAARALVEAQFTWEQAGARYRQVCEGEG